MINLTLSNLSSNSNQNIKKIYFGSTIQEAIKQMNIDERKKKIEYLLNKKIK